MESGGIRPNAKAGGGDGMSVRGVVSCVCGKVVAVRLNSQSVEVRHDKRTALFQMQAGQGTVTITCPCRRTIEVRLEGLPAHMV